MTNIIYLRYWLKEWLSYSWNSLTIILQSWKPTKKIQVQCYGPKIATRIQKSPRPSMNLPWPARQWSQWCRWSLVSSWRPRYVPWCAVHPRCWCTTGRSERTARDQGSHSPGPMCKKSRGMGWKRWFFWKRSMWYGWNHRFTSRKTSSNTK